MNFEDQLELFYKKLDLKGAKVIDVGAHTGRHAIPLAQMVGNSGLVYCFEPIPVIRKVLCDNIFSAALQNVIVCPFALSDKSCPTSFKYVHNLPEESGLKERHIYNAEPGTIENIDVQMFKLDDLIPTGFRDQIRFMKIDVEGGELDVLRGARNLIYAAKPIVTFECGASSFLSYTADPSEIYQIFSSAGYEIYSILGQRIQNVVQFKKAAFEQTFWDYVALPPGTSGLATLLTS
jgi:FkbM family methyltransferase